MSGRAEVQTRRPPVALRTGWHDLRCGCGSNIYQRRYADDSFTGWCRKSELGKDAPTHANIARQLPLCSQAAPSQYGGPQKRALPRAKHDKAKIEGLSSTNFPRSLLRILALVKESSFSVEGGHAASNPTSKRWRGEEKLQQKLTDSLKHFYSSARSTSAPRSPPDACAAYDLLKIDDHTSSSKNWTVKAFCVR